MIQKALDYRGVSGTQSATPRHLRIMRGRPTVFLETNRTYSTAYDAQDTDAQLPGLVDGPCSDTALTKQPRSSPT